MAILQRVSPYADDEKNLPVADLDSAVLFYARVMGFHVVSNTDKPHRKVILSRDGLEIGLAENGGDPTQEGCFFEVDNVEDMFSELKARGLQQEVANYRIDQQGETSYKVCFVIAPDGLCYCIGERQTDPKLKA